VFEEIELAVSTIFLLILIVIAGSIWLSYQSSRPPSSLDVTFAPASRAPSSLGAKFVPEIWWELVKLREIIEQECPESAPITGLLRPEMLSCLIQSRPINEDEFLLNISLHLRVNTDPQQYRTYRRKLFEIFEG
jgi:hypothetical protein